MVRVSTKPGVRLGRPPIYPWRTMKLGETFVFNQPSLRSARAAAAQMNAETGRRFDVWKSKEGVVCRRVE